MSAKTDNNNQEWTIQRHRQQWAHTQDTGRRQAKQITQYRKQKI